MSTAVHETESAKPDVTPFRHAFTLIELLVVIGIIAVLAGLLVTVGGQVVQGGKKTLTSDTLKVLDTAMNSWMQQKGRPLPPGVEYYHGAAVSGSIAPSQRVAFADGYGLDGSGAAVLIPTVSWFVKLVDEVEACDSAATEIKAINSKLVSFENVEPAYRPGLLASQSWQDFGKVPGRMTVIKDAWGNPLRLVHPAIDGNFGSIPLTATSGFVQLGGNNGVMTTAAASTSQVSYYPIMVNRYCTTDKDRQDHPGIKGYGDGGKCIEGRPYFYSIGADADPSQRSDNVYLNSPRFVQ